MKGIWQDKARKAEIEGDKERSPKETQETQKKYREVRNQKMKEWIERKLERR